MKGKKILSAIIVGVMVLCSMSFPVFAADVVATVTNGDTTTDYTSIEAALLAVEENGTVTLKKTVSFAQKTLPAKNNVTYTSDAGVTIQHGISKLPEINGSITFKGLNFDGNAISIYATTSNADLDVKIENCTFNNAGGNCVYIQQEIKSLTVTGCTFTSPVGGAGGQYLVWPYNAHEITITNNNFTGNGTRGAIHLGNATDTATVSGNTINSFERGVQVALTDGGNVTITGNQFSDIKKYSDAQGRTAPVFIHSATNQDDTAVSVTNNTITNSSAAVFGEISTACINTFTGNTVDSVAAGALKANVASYVAEIGDKKYATLADAVAAAQDGDTITILTDCTLDAPIAVNKSLTFVGDSENHPTLTNSNTDGRVFNINDNANPLTVNIKNINMISNGGSGGAYPRGISMYRNDRLTLNVDNCEITCGWYPINVASGNTNLVVNINNSIINGWSILNIWSSGTTITMNNSKCLSLNDKSFGGSNDFSAIVYNGDTQNISVKFNNTDIECKSLYGNNQNFTSFRENTANNSLTINSGTYTGYTNFCDSYNTANYGISISGGSFSTDVSAYCVEGFSPKLVNGVYVVNDLTSEIAVKFASTSAKNVYDIVLDGNREKIYELVSAEIQFVNAGNGYEISGTDDINVIPNTENPDRYGFYLKDGAVANRKTGTEIKIGTVTFPEQGAINFKVDANNSKVVATEYATHLEKYYTAADANAKLTADSNGINSTIAAKTRNVAINVDFAHKLDNTGWNGNHQITVTLKDAFGNIVGDNAYPLAIANNAGTYTFADVPVGRITVTLKAPGFRTYTYTTTVEEGTAPLVLSFWNDTKRDTTAEVEAGKTMTNNFVVGDIAMDYTVDKYDLAAVTSYYGTYNLTDTNKIKYDLNRDGNIDITDVAYVLHNFGF